MSWRPHTTDHCLRHTTITKYPSVSVSWLTLLWFIFSLTYVSITVSLRNYKMVAGEFHFTLTLSAWCCLRIKAFIQACTTCFLSFSRAVLSHLKSGVIHCNEGTCYPRQKCDSLKCFSRWKYRVCQSVKHFG